MVLWYERRVRICCHAVICHAVMLSCCHAVMLSCCHAVMLSCCHLSCCHAVGRASAELPRREEKKIKLNRFASVCLCVSVCPMVGRQLKHFNQRRASIICDLNVSASQRLSPSCRPASSPLPPMARWPMADGRAAGYLASSFEEESDQSRGQRERAEGRGRGRETDPACCMLMLPCCHAAMLHASCSEREFNEFWTPAPS
jgi:hypothetical protein